MKKKFQLGIKLWSTNTNLIDKVRELFNEETISYLELYCVPNTYKETIKAWSQLDIPYIAHAPNDGVLDISDNAKLPTNQAIFSEVQLFADSLNTNTIIVHPGSGDIMENIRQIESFSDRRICIENLPHYSLHNSRTLNGVTYKDIKKLTEKLQANFCLDIGHAIIGANNLSIDYI